MSVFLPLEGPVAPERNPAIEPQWFQPSQFPIEDISYGVSTTVTMGESFGVINNYVVGQLVRFLIPSFYGANQLNEQSGYVIDIPESNQCVVNIDTSSGYNPFISNPPYGPTPPQIVAVGDINSGSLFPNQSPITIPGAFENISPGIGVTP